jgi:hypothetical protein
MAFSGRLSILDSQSLAFRRRELWGKLFSFVVATAAVKRSHKVLVSQNYPLADFSIGDVVADKWVDEFEMEHCEVGEVVGICWHPVNCRWEYHINWTAGAGPETVYPCFDGHLTSHEVGAKLILV